MRCNIAGVTTRLLQWAHMTDLILFSVCVCLSISLLVRKDKGLLWRLPSSVTIRSLFWNNWRCSTSVKQKLISLFRSLSHCWSLCLIIEVSDSLLKSLSRYWSLCLIFEVAVSLLMSLSLCLIIQASVSLLRSFSHYWCICLVIEISVSLLKFLSYCWSLFLIVKVSMSLLIYLSRRLTEVSVWILRSLSHC